MKKAGLQIDYDQDDKFNAVVRRISSLPFVKPSDLDEAFEIFHRRANNLENEELGFLIMLKLSGERGLLSRTGISSTSTLCLFPALIMGMRVLMEDF